MEHLRLVFWAALAINAAAVHSQSDLHPQQDAWWESAVFYQLLPRSYRDSNGDGNGDLRGILERFDHLIDLGVTGICLGPVFRSPMRADGFDVSDFRAIDPVYGTMAEFEELLVRAKAAGLRVVLDLVPNHTSEQHEWFQKSMRKNEAYRDYYILREGGGESEEEEETSVLPNNWQSQYHTVAWKKIARGSEYYLHQFDVTEPDLNYRDAKVRQEMLDIIRYWLDRGLDGIRFERVNYLYEDLQFRDEPPIDPNGTSDSYASLDHIYTRDLSENYVLGSDWRSLFDEYTTTTGGTDSRKLMITSAYTDSLEKTVKWFGVANRPVAHIAQNFGLAREVSNVSRAEDFERVIGEWLSAMPPEGVANWALGNHDHRRVASRFGRERAAGLAMLCFTLPGTVFLYYGEEIGMEDNEAISWKETRDPLGCNTNGSVYQRYSRDPARTPFQWDASNESAGFAPSPSPLSKEPWLPVNANYPVHNLAHEKALNRSMYHLYRALIRWHQHSVTLRRGSFHSYVLPNNVFAVVRALPGEKTYVTVLNVNANVVTVDLGGVRRNATKARVAFVTPEGSYTSGQSLEDVANVVLAGYETIILELTSGTMWLGAAQVVLMSTLGLLVCVDWGRAL
uniref:alpha-glucosidase n=1 Tax=Anopheles farauti TaxID=69004 RepID=A0A182Q3U1_9DIPT